MPKTRYQGVRAICIPALSFLLAACASDSPDSPTEDLHEAEAALATAPSAKVPARAKEEWRKAMLKADKPTEGCFKVSHPSTVWTAVPCTTGPGVPLMPATNRGAAPQRSGPAPLNVGNGIDQHASVTTGHISNAEGSFPSVTGVTSSTTDDYTLQINANRFYTPLCAGAADPTKCHGWQQFAYWKGGNQLFMEYWLTTYNKNTCPAGWAFFQRDAVTTDCVSYSSSISVPAVPITDLANMRLTASAAATGDTVAFTIGNDTLYAVSSPSTFNLQDVWTDAEFNVFGGPGGGHLAFNSNVSIVVQTMVDSSPSTTTAPACGPGGTTAETNNLNIVSCCPVPGSSPGIQLLETNVTGATAQPCPLAAPPQVPVAFRGSNDDLWIEENGVGTDTFYGMMPGTAPSLVTMQDGTIGVAFQANTGFLWTYQNGVGSDTYFGMAAGTSPSASLLQDGTMVVAFQANTGFLWMLQNGVGTDTYLGMAAGTSPSLAVSPSGVATVAFQANTGKLWIFQNGVGTGTHVAVAAGTSPSVAVTPSGQVLAALQAPTGFLWMYESPIGYNSYYGMMQGTSPSLALTRDGFPQVAFQANTGNLWFYLPGTGGWDQQLGMKATSSPSIIGTENDGYQIAFEANTNVLWLDNNGVGSSQNLAMN